MLFRSLGNLVQLQTLYLSNTKIDSLPSNLGNLAQLQYLDLYGTGITSLPSSLGNLAQLKDLHLSGTGITSLPSSLGNLGQLQRLYLSGTGITSLPSSLGNLGQLQYLNLRITKIANLPEFFFDLKSLNTCNLEETLIPLSEHRKIRQKMLGCRFYFTPAADSARIYYQNKQYPAAYTAIQIATQEDPQNFRYWYDLSHYALFVKEAQVAIQAAQKSLALAPLRPEVEIYLALGYLLNDQWPEAEKIYLRWKGKNFPGQDKTWDQVFLEDIKALEAAGVSHDDFQKVRDLLEKRE